MYYYAPYEADRFEGQEELVKKYNLTTKKDQNGIGFYLNGERVPLGSWIVTRRFVDKSEPEVFDDYAFRLAFRKLEVMM